MSQKRPQSLRPAERTPAPALSADELLLRDRLTALKGARAALTSSRAELIAAQARIVAANDTAAAFARQIETAKQAAEAASFRLADVLKLRPGQLVQHDGSTFVYIEGTGVKEFVGPAVSFA